VIGFDDVMSKAITYDRNHGEERLPQPPVIRSVNPIIKDRIIVDDGMY